MLEGGCHCGNLSLVFETAQLPDATTPRACDCSFCTAHGAAWLSDADGGLVVSVRDPAALARYRQGSGTAQFLLCRDCGVLVAVVFDEDGDMRGAVNVRCLRRAGEFAGDVEVSPQRLLPEDRQARWRQLWIPRVRIEGA